MTDVRINSRSELESYGRSIKNFSDSYTAETNSLYRQFTDKAGNDSKGQAINAYFAKLNNLQNQVFAQLPLSIKSYGDVVTTYADAISGAGFGEECFSSDSGAESLSSVLKGEQTECIFNTSSELDAAFKQAADAMETAAEETQSVFSEASSGLSDAASKRIRKDQEVQSAFSSFTSSLETAVSDISGFQNVLNNASYLSEVSSAIIFQAIANGNLTAEEMYYLDVPQSKEDAQALEAIISEEPGNVLKVDPEKISDVMYVVIADEMNDWTATENNKMWGHFSNALGDNTVERNGIFTNGVLIGEDALAQVKMAQMYNLFNHKPILPDNATPEQVAEYQELINQYQNMYNMYQSELNYINRTSGLMHSIQKLEIGKSEDSYTNPTNPNFVTYYYYQKKADIDLSNGVFDIHTSKRAYGGNKVGEGESPKYGEWYENKTYSSKNESTDFGMSAAEYSDRIKRLEKEREEAQYEFQQKLTSAGVETMISFVPFGSSAVSAIKAIAAVDQFNFSDMMKNGTKSADDFKTTYEKATGEKLLDSKVDGYWGHWKKLSNGASDSLKAYSAYQSDINKIEAEEKDETLKFKQKLVDHGGWRVADNSDETVFSGRNGYYYDFNAFLRMHELDTDGLSGYANSQEGSSNVNLETAINKVFPNVKDRENYSDVIKYIKGEDTELTLADMNTEQMSKFNSVMDNLGENSVSNFKRYLDNKYSMEEKN
ncbi:hypothetical protein [uncultured Streptococcus sp.]|uniref:hypothetical protein n=1 Tax=uncultured Streptococcus sp. TaxID=83427 RepID=UPI0025CF5752|nr:hypothetical protein [uncultured Streptococcus sp.]